MPFTLPTTDLKPTPTPFSEESEIVRPSITNRQRLLKQDMENAWVQPLTNRQRKFVSALFGNGFNIAKAAKEADPSLSTHAATRKGKYWYSLPAVQNAIEVAYTYFDEAQKVRWEDLLGELQVIAFANIMDFHEQDKHTGEPVLVLPQKGDPRLRAISEISSEDTKFGTKTKIKLHDKLSALDKLIKLLDPKRDDEVGGGGVVVQNINIIPVPQGQFLPAQQEEARPLLELTPQKPRELTVLRKEDATDV